MKRSDLRQAFVPAAVFLAILIFWEVVTTLLGTPEFILPKPSAIAQTLWENRPFLWPHIGQTMLEVVLGISIAVVIGLLTAALLELSPFLRQAFYPLLVVSQTVPILALAPLLVIWFGFGIVPKLLVVTLFCYFPIAINTTDGFTAAEPEQLDLLKSMGATPLQIWRMVKLPAALP